MQVLHVGNEVFQLRFLPDGRRLLVGTKDAANKVTFEVRGLAGGHPVRLLGPVGKYDSWWWYSHYGHVTAVHPTGETCYIAWAGRLHALRTADGKPVAVPPRVQAHQVVVSPAGDRLLAAYRPNAGKRLFAATTGPRGGTVVWRQTVPAVFAQVAGFLPDGDRFVTIDGAVRIRSFDTGEELAAARYKPFGSAHPHVSANGRYLGAVGYHSMYFWDLTTLGRPRRISGSRSSGDFRSFAFHPGGKTVAVIHGGPTLVKVYDLATLQRVHTWKWKLGPLQSVAFSPDGTLGAAGSMDGRVVVWDVDG